MARTAAGNEYLDLPDWRATWAWRLGWCTLPVFMLWVNLAWVAAGV